MSLDVYLEGAPSTSAGTGIFIRENGANVELTHEEAKKRFPDVELVAFKGDAEQCYSANITHNLTGMADAAGLYKPLWRPEEIGITKASELIEPLTTGLALLKAEPDRFRALNPPNFWGTYEGLLRFVEGYLEACRKYPDATVRTWR